MHLFFEKSYHSRTSLETQTAEPRFLEGIVMAHFGLAESALAPHPSARDVFNGLLAPDAGVPLKDGALPAAAPS